MPSHRVLNKCSECGRTISAVVKAKDEYFLRYLVKRLTESKVAVCNECNPRSGWKVVQ